MKRSLLTGFLFLPFGISVHIYSIWVQLNAVEIGKDRPLSRSQEPTPVRYQQARAETSQIEHTMLLCLSKAFTLARSFLLFRSEIRTWAWFRTACCSTDNGPCEISCSSSWRSCASSNSDFGTWTYWLRVWWVDLREGETSGGPHSAEFLGDAREEVRQLAAEVWLKLNAHIEMMIISDALAK